MELRKILFLPFLISILIILISACNSGMGNDTLVSIEPTNINTSTPTTNRTPLSTISTTSTILLSPSVTKEPSLTKTPTITNQPTSTTPIETLHVLETVNPLLPLCDPGGRWELSPNGQWIVESNCRSDNSDSPTYLIVRNIIDNREWKVNFEIIKIDLELPDGRLWAEHWTSDNKFLYVGEFPTIDGGGFEFANAIILFRLNLITGDIIKVLSDNFHTYAFSPETDKLAYISEDGINILDTRKWETNYIKLDMEYCRIGDLLWSPSEKQIVFQTWTCKGKNYFEFTSYNFILLDLKTKTWKDVLSSSDRLPRGLHWTDSHPVYIEKHFSANETDQCWELDFEEKALLAIDCP